MYKQFVALVACVTFFAGCVSARYKTDFQSAGEHLSAQPYMEKNIRVFFSNAPKGFTLNGEMLSVDDGFKHRVLGQVKVLSDGVSPGTGAFIGLSFLTLGFYAIYYVVAAGNVAHDRSEIVEMMKTKAAEIGANAIVFTNVTLSGAEAMFSLGSGYAVQLDPGQSYSKEVSASISNPSIKLNYFSDTKYSPISDSAKIKYLVAEPKEGYMEIATLIHSGPVKESEKMINDLKGASAEIGGEAFFVKERKEWVNTVVCGNSGPPNNAAIYCQVPYERLNVRVVRLK